MEKERCNCVFEQIAAVKSTIWISCALDSPKKPLPLIPISSCWGTQEHDGFPYSAACDKKKDDKKNGWAYGPNNRGSHISISLKGSFYVSQLEIQSGYGNNANWKEFRIELYASNGGWRHPKNFLVTDIYSNILPTEVDGSKIKLTGTEENDIIVTFDVMEAYQIDITVDDSYMQNGNAILNEISVFGPGTMITYISFYFLFLLQNATVRTSVQ